MALLGDGKIAAVGAGARFTAKPEKVCPIQLLLKVAAPWGRGDLSAAASGYSISGFAIGVCRANGVGLTDF